MTDKTPVRACDIQTAHVPIHFEHDEDGETKQEQVGVLNLRKRFEELVAEGTLSFQLAVAEGLRGEKQIDDVRLVTGPKVTASMKIIRVDNFDRESVSDLLVAENVNVSYVARIVEALNAKGGRGSPDFFKAVPHDHELYEFRP